MDGHLGWALTFPDYVMSHYMLLESRTPFAQGSSCFPSEKTRQSTCHYNAKYLNCRIIPFPLPQLSLWGFSALSPLCTLLQVDKRTLLIIVTQGSISTCASTVTTAGKGRCGEAATLDLKASATSSRHHFCSHCPVKGISNFKVGRRSQGEKFYHGLGRKTKIIW